MYPYIYHSSQLTIGSYGVMLALAYLIGRYQYIKNLKLKSKQLINTELLLLSLLVFGVIGAKLMFILKNPEQASITDLSTLLAGSGFSSQGALLAAIIVTFAFSRFYQLRLSLLLDAAAPAAVLAYAIARAGCFLAGDDCYGIESSLPWAMSFPDGIAKTDLTVHPLPLYEIVYSIAIWLYLNHRLAVETREYWLFFSLLLSWGAFRFMIEFISTNPNKILFMSGSQFGALIMFLSATLFFSYHAFLTGKKKPG